MRTEAEIREAAADERPFSNASEHDIWADRYCHADCVHDNPDADPPKYCPIITVALIGKGGDGLRTAWPAEWTRRRIRFVYSDEPGARPTVVDADPGDPSGYEVVDTCTEYEERRRGDDGEPEPEPPPVCDGQLDIIDAYLPEALAELRRTPESVRAEP